MGGLLRRPEIPHKILAHETVSQRCPFTSAPERAFI